MVWDKDASVTVQGMLSVGRMPILDATGWCGTRMRLSLFRGCCLLVGCSAGGPQEGVGQGCVCHCSGGVVCL